MSAPKKVTVTTPNDREIVMTRTFRAPRARVFDALTKPELLKRWMYGPEGHTFAVCDMDVRPGGKIRWVWHIPTGSGCPGPAGGITEMGMSGEFREVVAPERLVHTELFDQDWTGGETLVTTVLTEKAGETTLTMTIRFQSKAARDGALQSPMAEGCEMGYARLDAILAAPAPATARSR
jgi:uncharacterized protein YndB with AHSA1/START domain